MKKRPKVGFVPQNRERRAKVPLHDLKTGSLEGAEYYLLSNFGAEKRTIFSAQQDYDRFEAYLHLLNAHESPRASNLFVGERAQYIFESRPAERLVAIGAYSFTPKSFLILATPAIRGGIGRFMQKLQTAYSMYFNKKYAHAGRLFHGPYISEKAQTEKHLKYLFARTHLAPAQLFNDEWENANPLELRSLAAKACAYRYSSIGEYVSGTSRITEPEAFPKFLSRAKSPDQLLQFWMQYRGLKLRT